MDSTVRYDREDDLALVDLRLVREVQSRLIDLQEGHDRRRAHGMPRIISSVLGYVY